MSDKVFARIEDLVSAGLVEAGDAAVLAEVAARYSVALPETVARLIVRPDDPIGRQFLPRPDELRLLPEEDVDPIGDGAHQAVKGLIHRYPDRVLLKLTSVCPVYCRFCFRRASVGAGTEGVLDDAALDAAFAYLAEHKEIWEVIVTGGDPLAVSPRRLAALSRRLAALPHVKILRFHSRVPVLAPTRITPELIAALKESGKTVYVAVHANHVREFTPEARDACARLADQGVALVSQTVLLRGVNDSVEALSALMRAFVEMRVKPYYLHHGDLAPGTSHFRLSLEEGQTLVRALLGRLSGLCQPIYVVDIPGGRGKAPAAYFERVGRAWSVEDWRGIRHDYADSLGHGGDAPKNPTPQGSQL
ncbi:lysine-2,3-aminomutase-like protein [Rhodoblastus acidophilus]|uniref:Lysine-2,3-aminomutase-like protein n=1 Tax=Rhodoblastus acidophilus TaxID=1074 RepID=A0A6N8DJT9_RHOAC|nr:lysine-2,3-aminomutase-like protein [Rhodoblastus acidophilus]MCW2274064.1 lysine 2,3-aminomutase [Rhodoblastus acidophilus]MTV30637.1 lysine-2,3-aminomutase-like protein [Rhodoblastus acidophilus]